MPDTLKKTGPSRRWGIRLQRVAIATLGAALVSVAGCASTTGGMASDAAVPAQPLYRCENNIAFTARFVDDTALLDSNRGYEVLYRDAGGLTPAQRVYSNPKMKAEFGLGESGREAVLRYPLLPLVAHCVRD
ncbi:MAG: hypothetical protein EOO25_17855 [Comamonadaceae bacterium]|nr:MAG: hypothetical protein EOO25_17855 [Comamonadaceae bacterium]